MPITVSFSDAEQQRIEGILIDKDQEEALRFCSDLLDKFRKLEGHACGPKAAEGYPGHG
jgi:hypothetical protein